MGLAVEERNMTIVDGVIFDDLLQERGSRVLTSQTG